VVTDDQPAAELPSNPWAIAGLIAGIAAVLVGWFPLFGLFLTLPALLLGLLGLSQAAQGGGGRGMALAAVILAGVASVASLVLFFVIRALLSGP